MQRSKSTQNSVTVLRKENEARIRKFLLDQVGPPPTGSLCPKHSLRSKRLCTSQTDRSLTHAGQWFSFCKPCDRLYFSKPSINIQDLVENNEEFRALIDRRRSLSPIQRAGASVAAQAVEGNRPVAKFFVFWTKSGQSPTLIPFLCDPIKPVRLVNYRVLLKEKGIKYSQEIDAFDPSAKIWVPLRWGAEYPCSRHQDILLKYAGVDVTNFGMYHS